MKSKFLVSYALSCPMMLATLLLFSACSPIVAPGVKDDVPVRLSRGASVLSHRGALYLLGGKTSTGDCSDSVGMATLAEDGTLSEWIALTSLPDARAFHSVVAYGEYLYLIGGENESGYLDDIWFAYVFPDGKLGSGWTKSKYSLPEGRAAAAAFIVDGRIYVAGGEGAAGQSDEVLSSRIWSDGKPGLWTPSSMKLPSARSGATALRVGGTVYLAGGKSSEKYLSDFLISEIGAGGKLGSWTGGPSLPEARAFAALVPDGDSVAVLGGESAAGATTTVSARTAAYSLGVGSIWQPKAAFDGPWSGQGAVLHGWACLPQTIADAKSTAKGSDGVGVSFLALSSAFAGPPSAKPAGGLVKKDSTIALFAAADETIRYTIAMGGIEPPDPDENSALYKSDSRPAIPSDAILKARSFKTGLEASDTARLAFRVDSTSLFYTVEKTIRPTSGYIASTLQETYSNGITAPTSVVWYELNVADRGWYSIAIRDKDDDPAAYTDAVHASLFEGSPLSLLQDSAATDIYRRQYDFTVYLAPGTYMLRVASTSGGKGGKFGMRFAKER